LKHPTPAPADAADSQHDSRSWLHTGDAGLDGTLEALPHEVDPTSLRVRVLRDTCKRARLGGPLYLLLWLTICGLSGFLARQPVFVLANAALLAAVAVARMALFRRIDRLLPERHALANLLAIASTLTNALHWGVLTATAGIWPAMHVIEPYMVLAVVGLTMGGSMGLAIHPTIRVLFPVAIVSPLAVTLPFFFSPQRALVAALGVIFAIYVVMVSRMLLQDYWRLLTASALLKRRAHELGELSLTDSLTGLRNRLYFDRQYKTEWQRACRQGKPIALLMLDLDHFKALNDSHGHPFGDECLRAVAQLLALEIQRTGDVCARFGGEEFIVMLVDTDAEGAMAVAERLLDGLRGIDLRAGHQRVHLTASIGVASTWPLHPLHGQRLIQQADEALYRAKRAGRDRAVGLDTRTEAVPA
jgi:diguanylate cyclase (GGDEF)-like protein